MLAALRPHPHRGDIVAAGVVVLTVFTTLVNLRFSSDWSTTAHFFFTLAFAAPVIAMAFQADAGDDTPRSYESILHVAAFILLVQTLGTLESLIGIDNGGFNGTWVSALLVAFCVWFVRNRNSAIMTLLAALTGVVGVVFLIDWINGIRSFNTIEWILFVCAIALTLGAVSQRDRRRRHAVSLVDAAGITAFFLGLIVFFESVFRSVLSLFGGGLPSALSPGDINPDRFSFGGAPAGWELVLLAFGFGLIAYGSVDRERVPSFIGVVVLSLFVFEAFFPGKGGPSLVGWPIVLLIMGVGLLAIGLRPRQDLPPEPPVPPSS